MLKPNIHRSQPMTVLQCTALTTSQKIQCAAGALAGQSGHGSKDVSATLAPLVTNSDRSLGASSAACVSQDTHPHERSRFTGQTRVCAGTLVPPPAPRISAMATTAFSGRPVTTDSSEAPTTTSCVRMPFQSAPGPLRGHGRSSPRSAQAPETDGVSKCSTISHKYDIVTGTSWRNGRIRCWRTTGVLDDIDPERQRRCGA